MSGVNREAWVLTDLGEGRYSRAAVVAVSLPMFGKVLCRWPAGSEDWMEANSVVYCDHYPDDAPDAGAERGEAYYMDAARAAIAALARPLAAPTEPEETA